MLAYVFCHFVLGPQVFELEELFERRLLFSGLRCQFD
jgi:hypothetical protein